MAKSLKLAKSTKFLKYLCLKAEVKCRNEVCKKFVKKAYAWSVKCMSSPEYLL